MDLGRSIDQQKQWSWYILDLRKRIRFRGQKKRIKTIYEGIQ